MIWFTHLITSGGGWNGLAFLGALHYMIKHGWLRISDLKMLVGASVGSIIIALLSIGYTPKELFSKANLIQTTDLFSIEVSKLVNSFGVDNGEKLVSHISAMFEAKGVSKTITFEQLYHRTNQRLVMAATCVNKHEVHYFDHLSTPHLPIINGIRASVSIPFLFTSPVYKGMNYVDGGVLDNFPLHLFKGVDPKYVFALRASEVHNQFPSISLDARLNNFEQFCFHLIQTLLEEVERLRMKHVFPLFKDSLLQIVTKYDGVNSIFLEEIGKKDLFKIGYLKAKRFCRSQTFLWMRINQLPKIAQKMILTKIKTNDR